jgi:glutamyl-tRNA synthetase
MRAMSDTPKTRFAPSPTGHLHLGNVRTALFNVLFARGRGGRFLLRIEDTDRARSSADHETDLCEDLRWLGLDWQEGPSVDGREAPGPAAPYRQSERDAVYGAYFERLIADGRAYPCFCSEQALKLARKAQLAAGEPPRYPGTCARLGPEEAEARLAAGESATLRFRVPPGERVEFQDLVRGDQQFETDHIGDFVIRRSDGSPAFFFSNALDDALMGVTHVLRGEDHLANTPRQLLLLQAFDLPAPRYGHISLIVSEEGGPLSKRHGAHSVRKLRETGFLPVAIDNHLARLGHYYDDDALMELDALAAAFDLKRLGRAPARHDEARLLAWQKEAVLGLDVDALWDWLRGHDYGEQRRIESIVPPALLDEFLLTVRENIVLPQDALVWAARLFHDPLTASSEAAAQIEAAGPSFFETALHLLPEEAVDFKAYAKAVGGTTGVRGRDLFMPLRAALTGETHGPEMQRLFALVGIERARRRLGQAATRS